MEDNNKTRIRLVRHKWPDEIENEKKQNRKRITLIVFIAFTLFVGILIGRNLGNRNSSNVSQTTSKIDYIKDVIKNKWYFGKDIDNIDEYLNDLAINGMMTFDVDPHTQYMNVDEANNWMTSLDESFVGIGVQFYFIDNQAVISRVFKDSPAEIAGVLSGDIINKVDNTSVEGLTTDQIGDLVRGEIHTVVNIEFIRQGKPVSIDITRDTIKRFAYGTMLSEDIGYLEITQFGVNTHEEVEKYLKYLTDNNAKKLILDLRDNGGGYLSSVQEIASYFLDEGEIVLIQEDKTGNRLPTKANGNTVYKFDDIIVLINENTASASEVLTAALQYHLGAETLGTKSYGKGTVQTSQRLSDMSVIKYTIAQWLTPDGSAIHNVGITPNYEVKLHNALNIDKSKISIDEVYRYDSVSSIVSIVQESLDFLGYQVKRKDGYFDVSTQEALIKFTADNGLTSKDYIDSDLYEIVVTDVIREWSLNREDKDVQLHEAVEIFNGK